MHMQKGAKIRDLGWWRGPDSRVNYDRIGGDPISALLWLDHESAT
jgi:hypothetical protein